MATLIFSEKNGAGSGTWSDNQTAVNFSATDVASSGSISPITPGTRSYEKYVALKVVTPASNALSAFSVYFNSTAPTDSSGSPTLTPYFGVTPTYTAPVSSASSIATTPCS